MFIEEPRDRKTNEVIEILPDGTVYYFDLEVCDKEAELAIDLLAQKQNTLPNFDFTASVFSLFVYSVCILSKAGWSTEDLIAEVVAHSDCDEDNEDDQ